MFARKWPLASLAASAIFFACFQQSPVLERFAVLGAQLSSLRQQERQANQIDERHAVALAAQRQVNHNRRNQQRQNVAIEIERPRRERDDCSKTDAQDAKRQQQRIPV